MSRLSDRLIDIEADEGEVYDKENILSFITAGNATFTVESDKLKKRYTYRVYHRPKDNIAYRYIVMRMYGPDNENNYKHIGLWYSDTNNGKWFTDDLDDVDAKRIFIGLLRILTTDIEWPDGCHFYKSGKCAVCGRKLTTPESIERGIGPECFKLL